jgi:hypothetical protein
MCPFTSVCRIIKKPKNAAGFVFQFSRLGRSFSRAFAPNSKPKFSPRFLGELLNNFPDFLHPVRAQGVSRLAAHF